MNKSNLKSVIEKVLKNDERLWDEENKILNQTLLLDLVEKTDEKLITLLLENEDIRDKFFLKINDVYVFKTRDFRFFIEENKVNNSYTQYKNRIGLSDRNKFLKDNNEVVLNFPYKDCVLQGGQSSEEGTDTYFEYSDKDKKYEEKEAAREEVFFNEVLAQDEIDRLFDQKALVNWKRYTQDGEEEVKEISRDESGTIRENLIIKGNNLLALHSLEKLFTGKIKLIYIDPPYYFSKAKKQDTFAYNSNFKLSTWLTFMKNRLDIAKELLADNGAIFVQINDDSVAELLLLLKEVFNKNGEDNFINKITVKTKSPSGFASVNPGVFETAEYILAFAKDKKQWTYNEQYTKSDYDPNYKWFITNKEEELDKWNITDLFDYVAKENGHNDKKEALKNLGSSVFDQMVEEFAVKNADRIFQSTAIGDNARQDIVATRDISKKNKDKIYKVERKEHYDVLIQNGRELAFFSKKIREIDGEMVPSIQVSNIWTDTPYEGIASEGGVTLKGGKKPEKLLRRIIEMSTDPQDIVLDYHLGSGTTCAVAHKLNRRYIGVEQLDYDEDDSIIRLSNVLKGENSGISKIVNWSGGGSFIYLELAKWNEKAKEIINKAKSLKELVKIFDDLYETYFLNYNLKIKEFTEKVINEENFKKLSLSAQKKMFLSMLDLNQMYVLRSEMADKKFGISKQDQELTEEFYKESK